MKKQYLAPMSAQMVMNITLMAGSDSSADLEIGGTTGSGIPALTPDRKIS